MQPVPACELGKMPKVSLLCPSDLSADIGPGDKVCLPNSSLSNLYSSLSNLLKRYPLSFMMRLEVTSKVPEPWILTAARDM